MIKIELEFATGKEARQALEDLLGVSGSLVATLKTSDLPQETVPAVDVQEQVSTEPAPEMTTGKKRRTKAEIEAEKTPVVATETPAETSADDVAETTLQDNKEQSAVTVKDLQTKAVELGRVGKKELCRAVLQKHGADSISTADKKPLDPALYATVLDEFNKL